MLRPVTALIVVYTLVLGGCASAPEKAGKEQLSSVKRIAVLSVGQERFSQKYVGVTVFGNEHSIVDVGEWNLNNTFAQMIAASTVLKPYEVIAPTIDRNALASLFGRTDIMDGGADCDPKWGKNEQKLVELAATNKVDALLILTPMRIGDYVTQTNQSICGLGFFVRGLGDATTYSAMHFEAQLNLVDGRSGKILASRRVEKERSFSERLLGGPPPSTVKTVRATLSRKPMASWSQADKEEAQNIARGLLEIQVIDDVLSKMLAADK